MAGGAADIHAIFGRNLRQLIGNGVSVSEVARDIGINRTQLSRYLYGEAFPRPDVLHRICVHFDVDARILTDPIENIRLDDGESVSAPAGPFDDLDFEPVSQSVLPDGFYIEWKSSWTNEGYFTKQLMLVYTDGGTRKTKLKQHVRVQKGPEGKRFSLPLIEHVGAVVAQPRGFAMMDQGRGHSAVAMTVFRNGFFENEGLYPGYKLSSLVFNRTKHHFKGPTLLERLPNSAKVILEAARSPVWYTIDQLPDDIQIAMGVLMDEDAGRLGGGEG